MPGYLVGQLLGIPAYREKTTTLVLSAQETLYKAILVLLTVTAIIWMAIFLYATFYYSYMPAISHARPVHLQFSRSCPKEKDNGMCDFPKASVTLTKRQQLLMVGQPYKILLEMEMPESPANQNLGMFLVCAQLNGKDGVQIESSCRSAMLHYKSFLHHALSTLFFSPFLLSGSSEEKQTIQVELYSSFEEDPNRPVTEAIVEIQSHHVEIYQTSLKIHAHFTGLRYVMFHWPVLSAVIGITTNLFFLTVIAFLSWFKFFTPKQVSFPVGYDPQKAQSLEERRALAKQRLMKERGKLMNQRIVIPSSHVATQKEDLNSASEPQIIKPKIVSPSSTTTASFKQVDKVSVNGSDSDSVTLHPNEEKVSKAAKPLGDRRSSDEFVVVPEPTSQNCDEQVTTKDEEKEKDQGEYESESLSSSSSSHELEFHKANENIEVLEENKENNPDLTESTESTGPSLRHRSSQQATKHN